MYKLVFLDIDGTILITQKEISDINKDAIIKYKDKTKIVIASGRPKEGVKYLINKLGLTGKNNYFVAYNGAKILNGEFEEIYSNLVELKYIKDLLNIANNNDLTLQLYLEDETLYYSKSNIYTQIEEKLCNIKGTVKDFDQINDGINVIKVALIGDPEKIDDITNKIPNHIKDYYQVLRSAPVFLEFLNKSVDKSCALKYLANYLNIDIKDTLAIGDSENDLEMIKAAGMGIAMENAISECKNAAKFITKSCVDNGVAFALDKFLN